MGNRVIGQGTIGLTETHPKFPRREFAARVELRMRWKSAARSPSRRDEMRRARLVSDKRLVSEVTTSETETGKDSEESANVRERG